MWKNTASKGPFIVVKAAIVFLKAKQTNFSVRASARNVTLMHVCARALHGAIIRKLSFFGLVVIVQLLCMHLEKHCLGKILF